MGEIADMMLDGTMDCETGEWNFDGADGPGWPMTGAEAAAYARTCRGGRTSRREREQRGPKEPYSGSTAYAVPKKVRAKIEAFGELRANDFYHWQVRKDGRLIADWWPHKGKFRIGGKMFHGNDGGLVLALAKETGAS